MRTIKKACLLIIGMCLSFSLPSFTFSDQSESQASYVPTATSIQTLKADEKTTSFSEHIEHWIEQLSAQPEFTHWKKAIWEASPLGPGTHGWVIHLYTQGEIAGYLIVSAASDQTYRLIEYGVGEFALFSKQTMQQSLLQLGLSQNHSIHFEAIYIDPMHAYWKITDGQNVYFTNAKTGEEVPFVDDEWISQHDSVPESTPNNELRYVVLSSAHTIDEWHDPMMNIGWLNELDDPEEFSIEQLTNFIIDETFLIFSSQLFDQQALYAFTLTSFHQWNDEGMTYLALEHNGKRYVDYTWLSQYGQFHTLLPGTL